MVVRNAMLVARRDGSTARTGSGQSIHDMHEQSEQLNATSAVQVNKAETSVRRQVAVWYDNRRT